MGNEGQAGGGGELLGGKKLDWSTISMNPCMGPGDGMKGSCGGDGGGGGGGGAAGTAVLERVLRDRVCGKVQTRLLSVFVIPR